MIAWFNQQYNLIYKFPQISRRWEWPLQNIIMKILSFPYMFMEGVSNESNCFSLLAYFSIYWFFSKISGLCQLFSKAQNLLEKLGEAYTSNFFTAM